MELFPTSPGLPRAAGAPAHAAHPAHPAVAARAWDARGPAVRLVTWGWEEAVAVRWSRVYTPRDGVHVLSMYVGWSMVLMCHVGCQSNTSS